MDKDVDYQSLFKVNLGQQVYARKCVVINIVRDIY